MKELLNQYAFEMILLLVGLVAAVLGTQARVLLEKRGIAFDRDEMEILVEAAVGNFNDAFFRDVPLDDGEESMLDDVLEDYGEVNTDEE